MKNVFIDANNNNSARQGGSAEYLDRLHETKQVLSALLEGRFPYFLRYFLSASDKTWKIKNWLSVLSLQEGTSSVIMDGKTLTLSAGDSLLVCAQST